MQEGYKPANTETMTEVGSQQFQGIEGSAHSGARGEVCFKDIFN